MFDSTMLDVAIGLMFVYIQLSLVSSAIKEGFEALIKKRALDLETGIRHLLNDPDALGPVVKLFDHPLIAVLYDKKDPSKPYVPVEKKKWSKFFWWGTTPPGYIPARSFALALMDIIVPSSATTAGGATGAAAPVPAAGSPAAATATNTLTQLKANVAANLNASVAQALLPLIDAAGNDVAKARENIESWFNSGMDAVTGKYKRWSQGVIFFIGLALTMSVNADSIAIVNSLSQDKNLREKLVDAAIDYAKEKREDERKGANDKMPKKADPASNEDVGTHFKHAREGLSHIGALGLPIGWNRHDPRIWPGADAWGWVIKVLGWLVTTFAISLGAPFWFDLLSKFVRIRAHEKSDGKPASEKPAA